MASRILILLIAAAVVTAQPAVREGKTPSGIAYDIVGSGPPVVLISGSNLDRRLWTHEAGWLSKTHTVVRYDLRAHGRSDTAAEPFSHVRDLVSVLDELKISRAVLVGLSAGATIALDVALQSPTRVDRLVLVSPSISGYVPKARPPIPAALMDALKAGDYRAASEALLTMPVFAAPPASSALVRRMVMDNDRLWTVPRELMQAPNPPAAGRLEELAAPTLVVAAESDAAAREQAEVIGARTSRARVVIVPGGGHLLNLTSPEEFRKVVEPFLRDSPAPADARMAASANGPRFEPIQPDVLIAAATLVNAFADVDGDNDLDLFVGFNGAPNRLYRNDAGVFVDVAATVGLADARATRAAAWGDFDADGDSDLVLGFAPGAGPILRLYRNDGGRFVDVAAATGLTVDGGAVRQLAWVDVDGDDDLDLFVAFRDRANALFRNDRESFRDIAAPLGLADARKTVGALWFDFDEDGDLDLYLGQMDGDANALYRNDRGRFVDVAEDVGLAWGGRRPKDPANGTVRPCAADLDGDGRLDLFTANYGENGLFLNRGGGRFEDVSAAWGIAIDGRYDACAFSDIDHDGRLDLYVNGTVTGGVSYRDYLFRNTGTRFEDVTPENLRALDADHGVQWADVDGDGDEDLALTGAGATPMPLLFRNMLAPSDRATSLLVRIVDGRGRATRAGAMVKVYAAGTRRLLGTRIVDSGSGYNAQSDMPVHFGLRVDALPGGTHAVDIEATFAAPGRRLTAMRRDVDLRSHRGRPVVIAVK